MKEKSYELSLSRDYVSDWGIIEAVRELIQNAIDQGDHDIYIDEHNILHIKNLNTEIPTSSLILGNTTKKEDVTKVGQFGEGYKLALLVLTRMGKYVTVFNNRTTWYARFKKSRRFGCEVLTIEESELPSPCGYVDFEIELLSYKELTEIVDAFPLIFEKTVKYDTLETEFGDVILDEEQSGKFYVQSLPIFQDKSFKYGYNFKPDVVNLDRDRKSINLYELKEIASKMLLATKNYELITKEINSGSSDSEYIRRQKVEMEDETVEEFKEFLEEKFEVDEDSIIITNDDKSLKRELESMGQSENIIEVPNATFKRILNTDRKTTAIIEEAEMKKTKVDQIENAYWQLTYELGEKVCKILSRFHEKIDPVMVEEIMDAMQDSYSSFELIRDEVKQMILEGEFTLNGKNGR